MILLFIKQNKLLNMTIFLISLIFCSLLLVLTLNINQTRIEIEATRNFKDKNIYQISDNLYKEKEKQFFSKPDSFEILNNFSNQVHANESYKYYNAVWQPIEISDFKGDIIYDAYYETGNNQPSYMIQNKSYRAIKSVQMNQAVFDFNHLQLETGVGFKADDYVFKQEDDRLPIILGSEYSSVYKTGDTLDILYYQRKFTAVVVGILEPSQKIMTVREPELLLNRYIILPLLDFEQSPPKMEGIFLKALLLSKINGNIITDLEPLQIRTMLNEISAKTGFKEFSVIGANSLAVNSIVNMTEINRNTLFVISVALFITLIALFIIIMRIIIKKNIDFYKVLLISGVSMNQIYRSINYQLPLLNLIGCMLPLVFIMVTLNNPLSLLVNYLIVVGISSLIIAIAVNRYTRKYFEKVDIVQQLKG
ncbi:ABC transporter ATP-binding protein [Paenibacillus chitinolyticus]|nr:ABC transporter ATP-binding protein [Paenibacillus chitinolyticus]MCY9593006.1 ABC transporter ATP-binding protein [Paenibacillus chitinolyticus]MCY9598924.1 ABC transporter ATP-binding protein [Paenibacillus chitinolyticus]